MCLSCGQAMQITIMKVNLLRFLHWPFPECLDSKYFVISLWSDDEVCKEKFFCLLLACSPRLAPPPAWHQLFPGCIPWTHQIWGRKKRNQCGTVFYFLFLTFSSPWIMSKWLGPWTTHKNYDARAGYNKIIFRYYFLEMQGYQRHERRNDFKEQIVRS